MNEQSSLSVTKTDSGIDKLPLILSLFVAERLVSGRQLAYSCLVNFFLENSNDIYA